MFKRIARRPNCDAKESTKTFAAAAVFIQSFRFGRCATLGRPFDLFISFVSFTNVHICFGWWLHVTLLLEAVIVQLFLGHEESGNRIESPLEAEVAKARSFSSTVDASLPCRVWLHAVYNARFFQELHEEGV